MISRIRWTFSETGVRRSAEENARHSVRLQLQSSHLAHTFEHPFLSRIALEYRARGKWTKVDSCFSFEKPLKKEMLHFLKGVSVEADFFSMVMI